jgi:hypothetical protein
VNDFLILVTCVIAGERLKHDVSQSLAYEFLSEIVLRV